jgi:hypothetical protein
MAGIPVNRAMLIGLGGQGQNALVATKKKMLEAYGEVPPTIKFLSIDSASLEEGNEDYLDANEYQSIAVPAAAEFIDDHLDTLSTWLDYENLPRNALINVAKGAGQIPMIGRFLLLFHLQKILSLIEAKLNAIGDPVAMRDGKWRPGNAQPRVIFFGSIAGGTGAGTLLDLACAMRLRTGNDWDYQAFLMLPGVFRGKQLVYYVEENAYGFLKQLDFFMSQSNEIVSGTYGDLFDVKTQDGIEYKLKYPFNRITLVGSVAQGQNPAVYNEPKDLSRVIGEVIYAMTGDTLPLGSVEDAVLVNQANFESVWNGGKTCLYRGIGIGVLRYPQAELMQYGQASFIEKLVDALRVGGGASDGQAPDADSQADDFRNEFHIQGLEGEQNQILEAILPTQRFAVFSANIPGKPNKAQVEEIWQTNAAQLATKVGDWAREASENMAGKGDGDGGLLGLVQEGLQRRTDEIVSTYGAAPASSFVNKLTGYFGSARDQMEERSKTSAADATRYEASASALKNNCNDAFGRTFGKAEVLTKVLNQYRVTLMQLGKAHGERIREVEVARFCKSVIVALGNINAWLKNIDDLAGALQVQAAERVAQVQSAIKTTKICEYLVMPDLKNLPSPDVSPGEFYAWFRVKNPEAASFWSFTVEAAWKAVAEFADEKNVDEALRETTLASVVSQMTPDQCDDLLRTAEAMAEPLLAFSEAKVAGHPEQNQVATLYMVAASPEFRDAFKEPKLIERLRKLEVPNPRYIDLADPNQAYFFRSWGCVPAYALREFNLIRSEYLNMSSLPRQWSLHLDKRWADVLPDLDPSGGEQADEYVWALATSDIDYFQRVKKAVNFYTFLHEEVLAGGKVVRSDVNLGNGLATARSAFFSKSEYVDQCKRHIDDAIKQRGNAAALDDLSKYQDRLIGMIGRADPGRGTLLNSDLRAIGRFIATLQR